MARTEAIPRITFAQPRPRRIPGYISNVNAGCRQLDWAQILAEGSGPGDYRIHEINLNLGDLRPVVMEMAKKFEIQWHLLEREKPNTRAPNEGKPTNRLRSVSTCRGWFLTESNGRQMIAAFVDAKGSCSCRLYDATTGHFLRKLPNARGTFRNAFAHVMAEGKEFRPVSPPDWVSTEKLGLPAEVLRIAQSQTS